MAAVVGIRGPTPVRYCECGDWTLQLIGSHYGYDDDGNVTKEPIEYSHYPALCPICEDEEKKSELRIA